MARSGRQLPGGNSSICFGDDSADTPVSSNCFANGSNQNSGNSITNRPSTGVHAPPGGVSSICLGDQSELSNSRQAPHLNATRVSNQAQRSMTVSANHFANGSNQNSGNILTDRPTTGVSAPPGGASSIVLGGDLPDKQVQTEAVARSDGAPNQSQMVKRSQTISANCFANGSNQNSGNTLTDRPSTGVSAPPGGASSIVLGGDLPDKQVQTEAAARSGGVPNQSQIVKRSQTVSANCFANGSNQNCGNTLTDRPSTAVQAPPGGSSSIVLGGDTTDKARSGRKIATDSIHAKENAEPQSLQCKLERSQTVSSNCFANGNNQNCGNMITDRPSTGVHAPPGGRSSVILG